MRKTGVLLAVLVALAVPALALAGGGININTAKRFEFTDCASGGSASQAITEGTYLFRVTTEDVWVCWASTCATGGEKFGAGVAMMLSFGRGGATLSCRSSGSTGDAIFTAADQ